MKKSLLAQFYLHHRLYNNVLADFSDEETNRRPHGDKKMNHVIYLAGHLLNTQYGLAYLAGVPRRPKWNDLFAGTGQSKARDNFPYPGIEEIKSEWIRFIVSFETDLTNWLWKRWTINLLSLWITFENSPLDKLFDNTVAGLGTFFNHHQAYHIGQIGILRRGFGKDPMRYDENADSRKVPKPSRG